MKHIEKQILSKINKKLAMKDKFFLNMFKRYTYTIYKMGFNDGFNWNNNK